MKGGASIAATEIFAFNRRQSYNCISEQNLRPGNCCETYMQKSRLTIGEPEHDEAVSH
jgi:hypothetical protein